MNRYIVLVFLVFTNCTSGDESNTIDKAISQAHKFSEMLNQRSLNSLIPYFSETDFSFDQPILAPGSGIISIVVDSEPENIPGEMTNTAGNYVVIDHENGEHSFLCHLKRESVIVSEGQIVRAGDQIAQCGNSGHSTAPGLHYHLQNTPVLFDGDGLPAQFQSFYANSKFIERGESVWSQYVSNTK